MFNEILYRILAFMTAAIVSVSNLSPFVPEKKTDFDECKNVIFMIGDGMGFNSIKMAEQVLDKDLTAFDSFPLQGESKTACATPLITTDSAAGGTALATGVRVSRNTVGVYPSDIDAKKIYPMNLCELAVSQGKAAGIVTTAKTYDATPADFSAHVANRDNHDEIHRQQINSSLSLLWGEKDTDLNMDEVRKNGFDVIWNKDDMLALNSSQKSFGQFSYDLWKDGAREDMPTLAEMTEKAVDLLDDDDDGFFLMVEAAHIDKRADKKDKEGASLVTDAFDKAISFALRYAEENGDTLVVVTADHETGGIIKLGGEYTYTTTLHTKKNVPLLVYGCDNFIKQGEKIENREIGRRTACVMGEKNFPIEVKVK